ncbi:MAG TPA: peptidoglycan DD-metalloendopeptidase family protein, partial [Gemmatimonadales bacterium]|nr:peptidoglycan DD-metalloendopeptidase family protein [Gemmatimonadales bacterium]
MKRLSLAVLLPVVLLSTPLLAQRPNIEQQMRDNQQRLENIRRERNETQADLERLRAQVHSLADELANLEHQRETTNRIVNELDRQILQLSGGIDNITVDLVLAQDALDEKRAVLERRLVDIYKRGPLYSYQVLFAAESFGDLLSRYKYLYLVSRQDRQITNDMNRLRDRIASERRGLVEGRDALERRRSERADELSHYVDLARTREGSLRETRRSVERAQQKLTAADAEERRVSTAIAALEAARREAEARGAVPLTGAITSGSLGSLDWPVDGRVLYQFGPAAGPDNTRITWHGIGIAAPQGTAVKAVAQGTVALVGPLGTYLTTVIVDHGGGFYTVYATLDDATVTKGQRVARGEVIGHVGGESLDQGSHLHFEIRGPG